MSRQLTFFICRLTLVLSAILLPLAAAQADDDASRSIYFGSVLNPSPNLAVRGVAAARATVILDLTIYDDGFAYGRLIVPARREVLAGAGSLRNGSELRLVFRQEPPGMYAGWAAQFAHGPAEGATPASQPGVAASFSGYRDYSFGAEGTLITGALALATEPNRVLNLDLRRIAEYASWQLGQGRIRASFTSPYWLAADSPVGDYLEAAGRARIDDFVNEGRRFVANDMLGWGWEMHEYVTLEGAAASYLSLLNHAYVYTGGAHPNTFFASYLLEVRPSGLTLLGINDLFRADSSWLKRLTPLILEDLARQEAAWVTQGDVTELTPIDVSTFTLSADGMTFYFAPYAMGPYVQGSFEVTLPFEALLGLAPAGGVLEAFGTGSPPR